MIPEAGLGGSPKKTSIYRLYRWDIRGIYTSQVGIFHDIPDIRGFFRAKCGVHPRFVGRKMDGIRKLSRYGRFMTLLYQHEQELMGISLGSAEQYILFSNGTSTTWGIKWNP